MRDITPPPTLQVTSDTRRETGRRQLSDTCTHLDWGADVTPKSNAC